MQPLATAVIRRPFHWGIAVVADADSGADIPDVDPEKAVSANDRGLVILVRHAQDVESFDGDFDWAEAEVLVRLLTEPDAEAATERRELYRGQLRCPSGRISVGDADGEVVHPAHQGWNEVVVSVGPEISADDRSPDRIRIDLLPS